MKTYTSRFNLPSTILGLLCMTCLFTNAYAQDTTAFIQRQAADTSASNMNMDAVYERPFLTAGQMPVAFGGYVEANTHFEQTDGISDGFSFQARRLTLFFSSTIGQRIKFLSELEFEGNAREIQIEFAAVDVEFHPLLNLRGGIVMNPIGGYNQNHDSPNWDFIDRPFSATQIIPTTLSSPGFGVYGKYFLKSWSVGYEAYLTNGFNENIIDNHENRLSLSAAKDHPLRFEKNHSGLPMFTGKLAVQNRNIGEVGISYMRGIYNQWKVDGIVLDKKRAVQAMALDFNTSLLKDRINITGEVVRVLADVPGTYSQQYGERQFGGFLDLVGTVLQRQMLGWEQAKLNLGLRLEYADFNQGKFNETGDNIADDAWSIMPAIAFRPTGSTVFRLNYRYQEQTDVLGNPPALTGAVQFGFSTYF